MTEARMRSRRRGVRLTVENQSLRKQLGDSVSVGAPALLHLGKRPGALIEIQGTSITYARAQHSNPDVWHSGKVFMDSVVQENAGVEPGDSVTVEPAHVETAEEIRIQYHAGETEARSDGVPRAVREKLTKRGVFIGDRIPIFSVNPTDPPCVEVIDVQPDAAGLIDESTSLNFEVTR